MTQSVQAIGKNNNTHTVQAESSKFASLLFDLGFQIVIPPRIVANVPEPIGMPSVFCIDPIFVYFRQLQLPLTIFQLIPKLPIHILAKSLTKITFSTQNENSPTKVIELQILLLLASWLTLVTAWRLNCLAVYGVAWHWQHQHQRQQ